MTIKNARRWPVSVAGHIIPAATRSDDGVTTPGVVQLDAKALPVKALDTLKAWAKKGEIELVGV